MKKILLITSFGLLGLQFSSAQLIWVQSFDQNDSIGVKVGANNLILNGGFETTSCGFNSNWSTFCPKSTFYTCDISNWTCTGGGSASYPHFYDSTFQFVAEGKKAPFFDNLYTKVYPMKSEDTSCLNATGSIVGGKPAGFPFNLATNYGGEGGISLMQTVRGLLPGNIYVLEFWAGGGYDSRSPQIKDGLFAVDVGFGNIFLRNKPTPPKNGVGTRFLVKFKATLQSHTIKFTSWEPICGNCSELILDNVRLYSPAFLPKTISDSVIIKKGIDQNSVSVKFNDPTNQIIITFNEEQKNTSVKIIDAQNKGLLSLNVTGKELTLEKGEMKKGVYTVKIADQLKNVILKKISLP